MSDVVSPSVAIEARIVSAGLLPGGRSARAVVVLSPVPPADDTPAVGLLKDWPQYGHGFFDRLARLTAWAKGEEAQEGTALPLTLAGERLGRSEVDQICALWQRLMAPCDDRDWAALWNAWRGLAGVRHAAAPVLQSPTAEAGIALPFERARQVLDAVARPTSSLLARAVPRPPAYALSALGRPWLGEPDALARLASFRPEILSDAARASLLGPPNPLDRLASGGDPAELDETTFGASIDADDVAARAAGIGNSNLLEFFDRIHALQHAANELLFAQADLPESGPSVRILLQLQATPSLLRFFGLARDIVVDLAPLGNRAAELFLLGNLVGPEMKARTRRTAVRWVRPSNDDPAGAFYPVSRQIWTSSGAIPTGDVTEQDGLANLRILRDGRPEYGLITVEPALAIAADRHHQAACRTAGTDLAAPPLRSGGLSLVRLGNCSITDERPPAADPEFSDSLRLFDRLDIGIDTDRGVVWRSPMHRTLRIEDPVPPNRGRADWIGSAINRLLGSILRQRRHELDAVHVVEGRLMGGGTNGRPRCDVADRRVAIWTGEPIGAGIDRVGVGAPPVKLFGFEGAIALDHHVELPRTPREALLPPLRFGWSYRFGLRRVFQGGVAMPIAEAGAAYKRTGAYLPGPDHPGKLYLRHEPIGAPMPLLAPDVPAPAEGPDAAIQSPERAVLVSWRDGIPRGRRAVPSTARVLMAPPVPLEFAALHEVFDGVDGVPAEVPNSNDPTRRENGRRPRDGLTLVDLSRVLQRSPQATVQGAPARLRLSQGGEAAPWRPVPYYPDPAAAHLVLALRASGAADAWFDEPAIIIPIRGTGSGDGDWPDVLPVYVTLLAEADRTPNERRLTRLLSPSDPAPVRWLDAEGMLHDSQVPDTEPTKRLMVRAVSVALAPGEQAVLDAWFVPTLEDLTSWFDVVESIAALATQEGIAAGAAEPAAACRTGIERLLGADVARAAEALARGAAGPRDAERRRIAAILYQSMLRRPLPHIAQVRSIHLIHAVNQPVRPPAVVKDNLVGLQVTRRRDVSADGLRRFLVRSGAAGDWAVAGAEADATEIVFGGTVEVEPASTKGIVVEITAAGVDGSPLDDPSHESAGNGTQANSQSGFRNFALRDDGVPILNRQALEALRIDGIPEPADGYQGARRLFLETVQLDAARGRGPMQVQRFSALADGGARQLAVRIVGIPRHADRLFAEDERAATTGRVMSRSEALWLPATRRPAPPDVHSLVPTFHWAPSSQAPLDGTRVWVSERRVTLRLYLRRPWYSSGEGERVGIVLWPPEGLHAGNVDEQLSESFIASLVEEDLGPVGRFVSAWGRNSLEAWGDGAAQESIFLQRPALRSLHGGELWHPNVLMPLPGASSGASEESFAQVALLSHEPRFDPEAVTQQGNGLWYVDYEIDVGFAPDPFVRLGVVRYQMHAREDRPGEAVKAIRCSPPSTAWAEVLPRRTLSVVHSPRSATRHALLTVNVRGPSGTAPTNPTRPSRGVRVRVLRTHGTQEHDAYGPNGEVLAWESWRASPNGSIHQTSGETTWSCTFELPRDAAETARQYAVVAEEMRRMPSASRAATDMVESGARYVGRIEFAP